MRQQCVSEIYLFCVSELETGLLHDCPRCICEQTTVKAPDLALGLS